MTSSTSIQTTMQAIRQRAEKATEGPWSVRGDCIEYGDEEKPHHDNLAFVACARTDIPRLLDALEEAMKRMSGEKSCPICGNIGWIIIPNRNTGDAERLQCQWCDENYHATKRIAAILEGRKAE